MEIEPRKLEFDNLGIPNANQASIDPSTEFRTREITAVGDGIRRVISALGLDKKLLEQRVMINWSEVVGEKISDVTRVDRFIRGELLISVEHDAWRHRLYLEKDSIMRRLNQSVGEDVVRSIRFRK